MASDGLPSKMSALPVEIEVIEAYLGPFLDELLVGHTDG